MDTFQIILQIIAALGLLNVWVLRISKKTPYRGKGAASMRREFEGSGFFSVKTLKFIGAG